MSTFSLMNEKIVGGRLKDKYLYHLKIYMTYCNAPSQWRRQGVAPGARAPDVVGHNRCMIHGVSMHKILKLYDYILLYILKLFTIHILLIHIIIICCRKCLLLWNSHILFFILKEDCFKGWIQLREFNSLRHLTSLS